MAGGAGTRLSVLSEERSKPAVPFAGRYRIIDFALSNCVNSDIFNVAVLTQYRPHSLNEHIGIGKPWDLDRARGGVRLLQPYQGRSGQSWYGGTAAAVYQNLDYVRQSHAEQTLVLSGDHIYKMDYRPMLRFHREHNADLTVAVMNVPLDETDRFGIMQVDGDGHVSAFYEKPKARDKGTLASMGIYVFNTDALGVGAGKRYPNARRSGFWEACASGDDPHPARVCICFRGLLGGCRNYPSVLGDESCLALAGHAAEPLRSHVGDPYPQPGTASGQGRTPGFYHAQLGLKRVHRARTRRAVGAIPGRLCLAGGSRPRIHRDERQLDRTRSSTRPGDRG